MRLIKKLFATKGASFSPDFSKSRYENWLDYLSAGGSSEEWDSIVSENKWEFPIDELEAAQERERRVRPIWDEYTFVCEGIERKWSELYHTKEYLGRTADIIEADCQKAIVLWKQIRNIDIEYGEEPMPGSPAHKRLAMLYEKQDRIQEAIDVCNDAISSGVDESKRLLRLLKKAR